MTTTATSAAAQAAASKALEEIVRRFAPKSHSATVITPNIHLIDDLAIDSPRMIDIVLDVEDHFGCTIEDQDAQKVRTFGDLAALVERCKRS